MQTKTKKKAFTLIELLIVIAIIGVLASIVLVSLKVAKIRSLDASFKTTAGSINPAAQMCCEGGGTLQSKDPSDDANVAVCTDTDITNSAYPDDDSINTVSISSNCNNGDYQIVITPSTHKTGDCTSATYNQGGLTNLSGCS